MQNRKTVLIKYLALMLILVSALLLSACRTRITNNNEVSNVYYDEEGYLSETYEMRRSELSLSTAKKPLLPDFGPIEDDEEEIDSGESLNYEPEEEEYVEPPEVQNANNTTTRRTTRTVSRSSSSSSSSSRTTERVTIKFDANGGKCNTAEKRVYKGSKIGSLPEATKDGKTTNTWYTSKTGGSAVKSSDKVNSNITLYARWEEEKKEEKKEEKVTVTFDGNGGTPSETSRELKKGSVIGKLPEASNHKDKKEFKGWSTSKDGETIDSNYKVLKNTTLYAKWKDPEKKEYEINFDANGGAVDEKKKKVIEGDSYGDLPTPKYKGHHFEGWFIGDTPVDPSDKPTQGEKLTAEWTDWDGEDGIFAVIVESLGDSEQNYILAENAPEGSEEFVDTCRGKIDKEDPDNYDYVIQFADDPETTGKELVDSGLYKGKTVIVLSTEALKGDNYDRILYQTVLINDLHGGFDPKVSEAAQEIGKYDRYIKKVSKK